MHHRNQLPTTLFRVRSMGTFVSTMRIGMIAPLLLLATAMHAQQDERLFHPYAIPDAVSPRQQAPADTSGRVQLEESARIRNLMAEYAARRQPLNGYRVQIFLGDRNTAEKTRREFLAKYPETPAYLSYLAPNFRVRVGDLRDRVTAEHLRGQLAAEFPGLYVVPDQIEPPRLQTGTAETH